MGASFATDLEEARARRQAPSATDRAQAVYIMQRHGAPAERGAAEGAARRQGRDGARRGGLRRRRRRRATAAKAVAAGALKDADPLVRRRAAEALVRQGLAADKPCVRAGRRRVRAAERCGPVRAVFGPDGARTDAARRVGAEGARRDQSARRDRRRARAGRDREERRRHRARHQEAARAAGEAVTLGRRQAARAARVPARRDREQERDAGAEEAGAQRADRAVSVEGRAPEPPAREDARLGGAARRDREDSRGHAEGRHRTSSCSSTTSTRCAR